MRSLTSRVTDEAERFEVPVDIRPGDVDEMGPHNQS
jgi:hypothetical protein